jgi:23S rRNA pseudouridine955/2504/2580 synthase
MSDVQTLEVAAEEAELRLDRWFKRRFPALGHGRLERLLRTGQVRVDGKRAKAGLRLEPGQKVRVPPLGEESEGPKPASKPAPKSRRVDQRAVAELQRRVLYRDDEVLAIDKPAGLAVQGGTDTPHHLDLMLDGLRFGGSERPRLVHRLDKDTSGVLLLARSARSAAWLGEAFRRKDARKVYWAVTVGVPHPAKGRIDLALDKVAGPKGERVAADEEGRRAVTYYAVVEHAGKKAAWLAMMPVTGRTHQLRVHAAAIGTPILGDGKYGGAAAQLAGSELPRQLHLHARRIRMPRPRRGWIDVTAPLPPHMRTTWQFLGFDPEPAADPFAELEDVS